MFMVMTQRFRDVYAERWLETGAEYAQRDSVLPLELRQGLKKTHSSNLCNGGDSSKTYSCSGECTACYAHS